jgi:integral membrane sensor domain MASE1
MIGIGADQEKSQAVIAPPLWARAMLFSLAYFFLAFLGSFLALKPGPFVTFWPPSGLFVATLLRNDYRTWPVFILAAFPANLGFDLWNGQPVGVSLLF